MRLDWLSIEISWRSVEISLSLSLSNFISMNDKATVAKAMGDDDINTVKK